MIEQDAIMHLYAINEHFRVGTGEALVRLWAAYDDGVMVCSVGDPAGEVG